jgi:hypothetical protein
MDAAQWIADEFGQIEFGDTRLHRRFLKVAKEFARQPGSSTHAACTSWAETKAAYRLFSNEKVTAEKIMTSHVECTSARASAFSTVLSIQDTTFLDFKTHKKTEGLGKISNTKHPDPEGLVMHSAYMLSPSGLPLGFGFQKIWARPEPRERGNKDLWNMPIETKESFKWLEAMRATQEKFGNDGTEIINICDREADVYELFCEAKRLSSHFIVRFKHDRAVNRTTRQAASGMAISELLRESPLLGRFSFQLIARQDRPQREVHVELRSVKYTLSAPTDKKFYKDTYYEAVEMYAVSVTETAPSEDPLEWILLTDLVVKTSEDAQLIAKFYSYRWRIEEFHRILKSGCKVEECRLQSAEKLCKHIALMTIISWRIHWLTRLAREAPETPCTAVFGESEWKGLCLVVLKDKKLLSKPPSLRTAIRAIASLGGFIGRKSDGEPGPETIWKGINALRYITETVEALL